MEGKFVMDEREIEAVEKALTARAGKIARVLGRPVDGLFDAADDGDGCSRCGESTNGQPGYGGCTDPQCPIP